MSRLIFFGQPATTPNDSLTADGISTTPTLGTPVLTQVHSVVGVALAVAPTLGTPILAQDHVLVATAMVVDGIVLGTPELSQPIDYSLTADGLLLVVEFGTPLLNQIHVLAAVGFDIGVLLESPTAGEETSSTARSGWRRSYRRNN